MDKELTLKKALKFINNIGSEIDKAKINLFLNREENKSNQVILDHFSLLQKKNGGISINNKIVQKLL